MNIGIRLHDTREGTLYERLGYAKEQGFSCAHLALSKAVKGFSMKDAPKLLTEELASQVRNDFSRQEMDCAVLGCYLNLANLNAEEREKTQEIYHAHLRFSRLMGAQVVGTETPPHDGADYGVPASESEEAYRFFLESVKPVVRWAEEEDAYLAIEPVYRHIISTPERAQRMLDDLKSEHVQIILDAVNLLSAKTATQADAIIQDAISRLGDKITILHMKDYSLPGDDSLDVISSACGTGSMRYERLLSFAKKRNIPMTLENTVPENARAAREYLENIGKNIE